MKIASCFVLCLTGDMLKNPNAVPCGEAIKLEKKE